MKWAFFFHIFPCFLTETCADRFKEDSIQLFELMGFRFLQIVRLRINGFFRKCALSDSVPSTFVGVTQTPAEKNYYFTDLWVIFSLESVLLVYATLINGIFSCTKHWVEESMVSCLFNFCISLSLLRYWSIFLIREKMLDDVDEIVNVYNVWFDSHHDHMRLSI